MKTERSENELDAAILKMIGKHRIGFGDGLAAGLQVGRDKIAKRVKELEKVGRIQSFTGKESLARGCPYFQLTRATCIEHGLPVDRSEPFNTEALSTHLAISWHVTLGADGTQFLRCENDILEPVLGHVPHRNQIHLISRKDKKLEVVRVYCPRTELSGITSWCGRQLSSANKKHRTTLIQGDYSFLILMQRKPAVSAVRRELQRVRGRKGSLHQHAKFTVALGPSTETFATEYARLKTNENSEK